MQTQQITVTFSYTPHLGDGETIGPRTEISVRAEQIDLAGHGFAGRRPRGKFRVLGMGPAATISVFPRPDGTYFVFGRPVLRQLESWRLEDVSAWISQIG